MSQMSNRQSFTLTTDGNLFSIGFAVGLIIGKLVLRNTMLAVAFATGLGLAVGMSAETGDGSENDMRRERSSNGHRITQEA